MVDFSRVTIMFSLPRSRSQWFTWFMGQAPNVDAFHDPLKYASHPEVLVSMIRDWVNNPANAGRRMFIADTCASHFHSRLTNALPGLQQFFVLRQPLEVVESLRRQVGFNMTEMIENQAEHLELVLERVDRRMIFDYHDLSIGKLNRLWDYVTDKQVLLLSDLRERSTKVVDRPLREQYASTELTQSLMAHREFV